MRASLRLLASAMPTTKGMSPGPMALLPPVYLYRRLLRAHRKHLPSEMRLLGDEYIKAEFRAHREVENPVHLVSPVNVLITGAETEMAKKRSVYQSVLV